MRDQMDLFAPKAVSANPAEVARDEALDLVERGAPPGWMGYVRSLIVRIERGSTFTTDDLWNLLQDNNPREPRAMGAVIHSARKEGLIAPTGVYRKSQRIECHARPVAVWTRRA